MEATPPRSFAELEQNGAARGVRCRRCGTGSGHRLMLIVQDVSEPTRSGNGRTVASHSWRFCEPCAVEVFDKVARTLK
jgi:hypothetical protein